MSAPQSPSERINGSACRLMVLISSHQAFLPGDVVDEMFDHAMRLFAAADEIAVREALYREVWLRRRPRARALRMWRGLGRVLARVLRAGPAAATAAELPLHNVREFPGKDHAAGRGPSAAAVHDPGRRA
jgi:hypothetical protein